MLVVVVDRAVLGALNTLDRQRRGAVGISAHPSVGMGLCFLRGDWSAGVVSTMCMMQLLRLIMIAEVIRFDFSVSWVASLMQSLDLRVESPGAIAP